MSCLEDHRQKVCKSILNFISLRTGQQLSDLTEPDKLERQKTAVDYSFRCGRQDYVLEHTLIESLPDQIQDDRQFMDLLGPLETELSGKLPSPGHYNLTVHFGAVKGAKNRVRIQELIKSWVLQKAGQLEIGSPATAPRHFITEKPDGVPFEITLYRWGGLPGLEGRFLIQRFAPEDLKEKRRVRIRIALDAKCKKLAKSKEGFKGSILVLESNDIALANAVEIGKTLALELQRDGSQIPDEIYSVETETPHWVIWILKFGDQIFPTVERAGPYFIDSNDLTLLREKSISL